MAMTENEQVLIDAGMAVLASFERYQKAFGVQHRGDCDCPRCVDVAFWRESAARIKEKV